MYCQAPAINTYINSTGEVFPCCAWQQNHAYDREQTIAQMATGIPAGCSRCAEQESRGQPSVRANWNQEAPVPHAEIAVDNTCNLECVMCSSVFSHRIYRREQALFGKPIQPKHLNRNTNWQQISWEHIQHLRLYGGEPTVSTGTQQLLQHLNTSGHIGHMDLVIPTNCVEPPDQTMVNSLRLARQVTVDLSIDAWGDLNSWQRPGADWQRVYNTLTVWRQHRDQLGINLTINASVTPYTINSIDTLVHHAGDIHVHCEPVLYPTVYDVANMPDKLKQSITTHYSLAREMLSTPAAQTDWQFPQHHRRLVEYYGADPQHLYPHLIPYIN